MTINISNILAQLNTKMSSDSSASTTELLRRVQAYNSLNNINGVIQYKYYSDLPSIDSSNVGQIVYVSASEDDSFGTFFFARAIANDYGIITSVDSLNAGWQKIVLNANDSDNFANITDRTPQPYTFQGSSFGYITGGAAPAYQNVIQKISFTTDGNSTDVGDLAYSVGLTAAGNTSLTHGYTAGGLTSPAVGTGITNIQKFPFAAEGNASDVGTLSGASNQVTQSGQSSENNGYASAGSINSNEIQKWPFATDGASTDVGDLTVGRGRPGGHSSTTHGYNSGGEPSSSVLDKFPFATDANATDVGNPGQASGRTGTSSDVSGYISGGTPVTNAIGKFPFSTDADASFVANLTTTRQRAAPSSSIAYGYSAGGGPPNTNVIDKWNFIYDENATDVGDLLAATGEPVGQQQT
jgi:hypothetical protein